MLSGAPIFGVYSAKRWNFSFSRVFDQSIKGNCYVVLLLLSLSGFLFYYGLGGEFYRTESLRAIVAEEFLRSGNWIVPTLYGEPLLTKPPGMYAAIAIASLPMGHVTEWSARLPSALAATITVFLFFWYFTRQLGLYGGVVAALLVPLSLMWLDKATTAEIDMIQVALVTAAILLFLRGLEGWEDREAGRQEGKETGRQGENSRSPVLFFWFMGALLCVAGGVLTKWTAPAFFYGTILPLLWWRGRLRLLWSWQHLVSCSLGAFLCLAWSGAVVARVGWEPFFETVSREALTHLSPADHPRSYPWGELLAHPLVLLWSGLPGSVFALLTLRKGFADLWDPRERRLLQALHCWTWPNIFVWSLFPEHSPRHSFPLLPGMAGLAAMVWVAWLTRKLRWPIPRVKPAFCLFGMVVLWMGAKVAFVQVITPARNPTREPRAKGVELASQVPEGKILYVFKVKDEGIMFYYDRPVRRLGCRKQLPSSSEPVYCILNEAEWQEWQLQPDVKIVLPMVDEQGKPIFVVRVGNQNRTALGKNLPITKG